MNAIFRVVTRIQDQDDFSGNLTDGDFLRYNSSTENFELESLSPGGDSGQLQYNNNGAFAGINHSSIGISGDIFKLSSLAINDIPLAIKGYVDQVGNLTEWRDVSDSILAKVDADGDFTCGAITASNFIIGGTPGYGANAVRIGPSYAGSVKRDLIIGTGESGIAGGMGSIYFEANGFLAWKIDESSGSLIAQNGPRVIQCGAITASGLLNLQNSTTPTEFNLHNTYTSATSREYLKMLAVTGGVYQIGSAIGSAGGTNRGIDFGRWNAAGTWSSSLLIDPVNFLLTVPSTHVFLATAIQLPSNGQIRGTSGNITLSDHASGTNFNLLRFGGTSSSYPAIKRNAAAINFRLADDSADADLTCGAITTTGDLLFTDATHDIGKSGATRPRDGFFSRNLSVGGILTVIDNTHISATSFENLQFKANAGGAYQIGSAIGSAGGTNRDIQIGHWNSAGTFTAGLTINTSGHLVASYTTRLASDGLLINGAGYVIGFSGTVFGWTSGSYISSVSTPEFGWYRESSNHARLKTPSGVNGTVTIGSALITQSALTTGSPTAFTLTAGAHTTLTTSTEATDVDFNLARTVQFATGALATQRAFRIQAPTYAFAGSSTITTASTLSISGAPVAGTNATITNAYALNVESGDITTKGSILFTGGYPGNRINFAEGGAGWWPNINCNGQLAIGSQSSIYIYSSGGKYITFFNGSINTSSNTIGMGSADYGSTDVTLTREGAGILSLRNVNASSVPYTFRLYNTYTSATSNEFLQLRGVASANFEIGPQNGSAGGTLRGLTIGGYSAGSSTITPWLTFNNAGAATFSSTLSTYANIELASQITFQGDSAIRRTGSGAFEINNGTPGTYRDLVVRDSSVTGNLYLSSQTYTNTSPAIRMNHGSGAPGGIYGSNGVVGFAASSTAFFDSRNTRTAISNGAAFAWANASAQTITATTFLYSPAAGTIAQRDSTNTQCFQVYNTYTSSTNFELIQQRGVADANFEIGPMKGSAGGTLRGLTIGGYANESAAITPWLTFSSAGAATFANNIVLTPSKMVGNAGNYGFGVSSIGASLLPTVFYSGSGTFEFGSGIFQANQAIGIGPTLSGYATTGADTLWYRDASGIFAQRNSTNAQTLRVYNTYTSATSNEFLQLRGVASANFEIGPQNGSAGGTLRGLTIGGYPAGASTVVGWAQFRPNASTGALESFYLGPITDNTAIGGNTRGAYSVDLQMSRLAATQVASGLAAISIGVNCTASCGYGIAIGSGASALSTSNSQSAIAIGSSTSSNWSSIAIGAECNASAGWSTAIGYACAASGIYGIATGGNSLSDRRGQRSHASGIFAVTGDAQRVEFILRQKTIDATPVTLMLDGASARLTIPSGKTMSANVMISGIKSDGSAKCTFFRKIVITNVGGTTTLDAEIKEFAARDNPLTDVVISADDTNDALNISVTGIAGETWRWVAVVEGLEIAYGT